MGTRAWLGLAIFFSMWTTNLAVGADWSLVPSVTQKSEFNSNINLTFTNPISDYIFTLQPAMDFNHTTEISQLQGHLGLSGQHFITQSQLDHIDQNYQIKGQYQVAPRVNLSLNTSYIVDTTLQQELLISGLVMSRTPRTAILANPGVTYNITERWWSTAYYNFGRVLYQDPHYTDYTSHIIGLNFNYLMKNERTTLINTDIVRTYLYPGGNSYKTLGIYLGGNHKFTENWEFNLLVGMNINNSNFATQVLDYSQVPFYITVKQERTRNTKGTPYFNVSTTRRWTNLSISVGFSRDQAPSAYGYVTNYNRLYGLLRYNFTERLSGTLGGDYSLTTQASQTNDLDYNYYNINTQLVYRLTEKLSITPGYKFSQRNDSTGGWSAHAHSAWVMLSYTYPIHYQK
jgi:hypothetical protein